MIDITIRNLKDSYNDRAYVRKAVKIYMDIIERLKDDEEKTNLYIKFELKMYYDLSSFTLHLFYQDLLNN